MYFLREDILVQFLKLLIKKENPLSLKNTTIIGAFHPPDTEGAKNCTHVLRKAKTVSNL